MDFFVLPFAIILHIYVTETEALPINVYVPHFIHVSDWVYIPHLPILRGNNEVTYQQCFEKWKAAFPQ